jgi:hypothetical protein
MNTHCCRFIGYRSASGSTTALPLVSQDSGGTQNSVGTSASQSLNGQRACSPPPLFGGGNTCQSSVHSSGSLGANAPHAASSSSNSCVPPASPSQGHGSRMQGGLGNSCNSNTLLLPPSLGGSIPRSNSDASGSGGSAFWGGGSGGLGPTSPSLQQGSSSLMQQQQQQQQQLRQRGLSGSNPPSVACVPAFPPNSNFLSSPVSAAAGVSCKIGHMCGSCVLLLVRACLYVGVGVM